MIGSLIVGTVFLVLAFAMFYVAISDKSWFSRVSAVALVVAATMFLFAGGYQHGRGESRDLGRLDQTNLKVLAACTNNNTIFVIGLSHNGKVQTFSYASSNGINQIEVGRYHFVLGNGKITPFPREETGLPSNK